MTVIVIDDSPTRRLALIQWLLALGHGVRCYDSVREVLDGVEPDAVDLVLVALVMDEGNGFDSGTALRKQGFSRILLLADMFRATDDIWAKAQGLTGVVSWPLREADLEPGDDALEGRP